MSKAVVEVPSAIAWKAHQWLGDECGFTNYQEYHVVQHRDCTAFHIPSRVAILFKLTWGGR